MHLARESALRAARRADRPVMDILKKAPILASSTEKQYTADTVAQVAAWVQAFTHQNSASALCIWRLSETPRRVISGPESRPLDGTRGRGSRGMKVKKS